MGNIVFNKAKGRCAYYTDQVVASAATFKALLLRNTGLVSDDTMEDYLTVAAMLAGNTEESDASYARVTLSGVSITQDNTGNQNTITCSTISFPTLSNGSLQEGALVVIYVPTGATDSTSIPVAKYDAVFTPDGSTQNFSVPSNLIDVTN